MQHKPLLVRYFYKIIIIFLKRCAVTANMPTKKVRTNDISSAARNSLGTHAVMPYTHLPTHTSKPWFLGCLSRGLRETMTWGHLTVMEPFVRGNSHFPASPFTKQSMWTGAMVKDVWRRRRVTCVLSVWGLGCCHSNVLLQEGNLRGEWEMSSNGKQREKWDNWIWLHLSVRTGQA